MEEIILPYATLRYKAPIVYLVFKPDVELGFPEMLELVRSAEQVSNYTPYFILSNAREKITITPEGRKFSAQAKNAPYHRGTALLVKNSMLKAGLNFFAGLNPPAFPFRVFSNEEEAIHWLLHLPVGSAR